MKEKNNSRKKIISKDNCSTLVQLVQYHAFIRPEKAAIVFLADGENEADRVTYGELDRRARIMAARIQSGNSSGQNILLLLPTSIDYVVAFFGCLYAKAVPVPVYPPTSNMHAERVSRIITDCDAKLVITTSNLLRTFKQKFEKTFSARFTDNIIAVDEPSDAQASEWTEPDIFGETLAYLQYTSGSTGDPSGVMVTHANVLEYCRIWQARMLQDETDVYVSWLPLFHDLGLIMGIIQPLFIGATNVIMPPVAFVQKPIRWLAAISKYRGTATQAPNFAFELCVAALDDHQVSQLDLSSLKIVTNAAEPVRADTITRFAKRFSPCGFKPQAHRPAYGLAEATLVVTVGDQSKLPNIYEIDANALAQHRFVPVKNGQGKDDQGRTQTAASCGYALPDIEILIVDPVSREACEEGMVGEIWVSGPTVAAGYWKRSKKTGETFHAYLSDGRGPFLRTGDLGVLYSGELYITGRIKDVVIIRGQNHYPQDIEYTAFEADPAVAKDRGAAFSVEADGEEKLVVVVEVRRTVRKKIDGGDIVQKIRAAIAERHGLDVYAIQLLNPVSVHITSSGKIQRKACRRDYLEKKFKPLYEWRDGQCVNQDTDAAAQQERPGTVQNAEQQYLEITKWLVKQISRKKRLSSDQVLHDMPFNRFGLDSMELLALSGELSTWLGREVKPTLVYDYPDIGRLARHLSRNAQKTEEPQRFESDGNNEPMAIVGMACRLPGAPTVEAYWNLLESGTNAITTVPPSRWPIEEYYKEGAASSGKMNTRWGGFIEGVDEFDAHFFEVAPREAESMDPQQRLLLEVAWHALEQAGIPPLSLAGTKTGVFIGICGSDYRQLQFKHHAGTDAYSGTGNALSVTANRISYFLDLRGPSLAVDTACSSSLVALHQACASLRSGECDLAIVGGVNLLLAPELTVVFSQAQMMAADGQCKTFDASADGYVRSEGCAVVVLKRRADALRNNDSVVGLIVGSAVNQDGKSNGLSAPNGPAQEAVERQALAAARVPASRISYVEAHGTGTSLGDPIEMNALKAVYGAKSSTDPTVWIGSVKTNIGHLEAAAGLAGLIKAVLAMKYRKIPPHLHFQKLNPNISLDGTRCAIPTSLQPWPGSARPRIAAVSSFGFGGTNAHLLVQEAPGDAEPTAVAPDRESDDAWQLLVVSARSSAALRRLTRQYEDLLMTSAAPFAAICNTAAVHRAHHQYRFALLARSGHEAAVLLQRHHRGEDVSEIFTGVSAQPQRGKIAFLFTGQGSQYARMGYVLYRTHAGFRSVMERCNAVLQPLLGRSLEAILSDEDGRDLAQTSIAQPVIFALEYALVSVWQSCGIEPAYVIGHSLGEYVAACIAGVFSLEDGLALVAHRGRLMQDQTEPGEMLAVHGPVEFIAQFCATFEQKRQKHERVTVATRNSPQDIVLSGDQEVLETLAAGFPGKDKGVTVKRLRVNRAFHSPLMNGMIAKFKRCAEAVTYRLPRIPVISNVTGKIARDEIATADYWVNHVLQPVLFSEGLNTLTACGCRIFLEIGPHPVLTGYGQQVIQNGIWLQSLRRDHDDAFQFQRSLGQWYAAGGAIDWERWSRERASGADELRQVSVPRYPFQPDRYWFQPGFRKTRPVDAGSNGLHPLLGPKLDIAGSSKHRFENMLSIDRPWFINQHRVFGLPVLPAAAIVEWALAALSQSTAEPASALVLQNVEFRRAIVFPDENHVAVQASVDEQGGGYRIRCFGRDPGKIDGEWREHASMTAHRAPARVPAPVSVDQLKAGMKLQPVEPCYEYWQQRGIDYGPAFRGLKALWRTGNQAVARVECSVSNHDAESYRVHPVVLDACFHSLFVFSDAGTRDKVMLPVAIEQLSVYRALPSRVWCRTVWHGEQSPGRFAADLELFSESGDLLADIRALQLAMVPRSALGPVTTDAMPEFYETRWLPLTADGEQIKTEPPREPGAHWLIYCNDAVHAKEMQAELAALGYPALAMVADEATGSTAGASMVRIDPHSPRDVERVFSDLALKRITVRGLLFLYGNESGPEDNIDVIDAAYSLAQTGFSVIKQFLATYAAISPDLVICTRGASFVDTGRETDRLSGSGLAQSVLTGMAKAVTAEYPLIKCVHVDLDPGTPSPSLKNLLHAVSRLPGAGHIALRGEQWYEARLQTAALAEAARRGTAVRPDATYLITGGMGGIGRSLAEWLVQNGARFLVLIGRSLPSRGAEVIRELENGGARVTFLQGDIADDEAWGKMLPHLDNCQPPIRGIVHAAGVIDDGVINQLDWPRFARVMAVKVRGSWHLHRLAERLELDFLVFCSSITALIGSAGQCNYIAANAFLDSLANYRRQRGMKATSINWGPWSEVGMAARPEVAAHLAQIGLRGINTRSGVKAFASVLSVQPVQIGVAEIDWPLYAAMTGRKQKYTLLTDMETVTELSHGDGAGSSAEKLAGIGKLAPEAAKKSLLEYLLERVARVLRLDAAHRSELQPTFLHCRLNELGLDSLMAIELRNQILAELAADVPVHYFIGGSEVEEVVDLIRGQLMLKQLTATESKANDAEMEECTI